VQQYKQLRNSPVSRMVILVQRIFLLPMEQHLIQ